MVPATALKFYVYGNGKRLAAGLLNCAEDSALVQAQAATAASIAVSTAMNPVFVVKARLQLDVRTGTARTYANSLDCVRKIVQKEGIRGLYQGPGASYLDMAETVLQLVFYEQLKQPLSCAASTRPSLQENATWVHAVQAWVGTSGAAGAAKLAAVVLTYPHEVCRCGLILLPICLI